jgi:hypothetical protein
MINSDTDAQRLKKIAFEQLNRWEQEKKKRPKMILFCDDVGKLIDVHIEISVKNKEG